MPSRNVARVKVMILGGTRFLGRHLALSLLSRAHDVTLYHRGKSLPLGVPGARNVVGDRDVAIDCPETGYDAIVDTCGFVPRQVERSMTYFKKNSPNGSYVFVSSISAYDDRLAPDSDEQAPLWEADGVEAEEVTSESYGPLKAACERAVVSEYQTHALVVRPGLVVGPWDRSDRFTYWVRRLWLGGDVLVPGSPFRRIQVIDARDLADWFVLLLERGVHGSFNATGPDYRLTFGDLITRCAAMGGSKHALHWAGDQFLIDAGVQPWTELPLWIPADESAGFESISSGRAQSNGLTYRSIDATIADTLSWDRSRGLPELTSGLPIERERALIERLRISSLVD